MNRALRLFASSALALTALLLPSLPARAVIRDGDVDPANLGQGGWLYLLNSATNHLAPNKIAAVTNENSLFLYLKNQGLNYVIVKAGTSDTNYWDRTYSTQTPVFTSNLVNLAHANGLKIFGSNRSWGSNILGEIWVADYVFNQGADGFIYDAESEWEANSSRPWITNAPAQAWWLCGTVRSNWPTKFIAHNPYDTLYLHSVFPFKEFGYWTDCVMPQVYHHSASKGNAFAAIHWMDVNYKLWQDSLYSLPPSVINGETIYWTNSIKPLALMRDVYGANFSTKYPPQDVGNFIDYLCADPNCVTEGGYQGSDYFRSELHDTNQWAYIKAATIGNFPGVVKNIVLDDAAASVLGPWTPVKTIDATTSTVLFSGATGKDTNSFGTNYFSVTRGDGTNYMEFVPNIVVPGDYKLYQWHPSRTNASTAVPFLITSTDGCATIRANQQTNSGNWSLLGKFNFAAGTEATIRVTDGFPEPGALALVDAIKLVFVASNPPPPGPVPVWGDDSWDQLQVPSLTNVSAIAAGAYHNLALLQDGTVVAWGDNWLGQCVVPPDLTDVVAIAAGAYHNLALKANGRLVAWGENYYGQAHVPSWLPPVMAIAAGTYHNLALCRNGRVVAWGFNNLGQCSVPPNLCQVVAIAAGGNHSLALRADGTVVAWGENYNPYGYFSGQSIVPQHLANVVGIAAGDYHSLAVRADGTVVAWGDNSEHQCDVPLGLTNAVAVAGGAAHSLALRANGTLLAWGANWSGQCNPPPLRNVVSLSAGAYHSVALVGGTLPPLRLLSPLWDGNGFTALAQTLYRKNYTLEYKDLLAPTIWTAISTNSGNGALQLLTDPAPTGSPRFYRLREW